MQHDDQPIETSEAEAQPYQRVKCDGNHVGPRCADPECWNDTADAVSKPYTNVDEMFADMGVSPSGQGAAPTDERLYIPGVFLGADGLRRLAESDEFWSKEPYGTRLYFGDGVADYLHRDVLRAAVSALRAQPAAATVPADELERMRARKDAAYLERNQVVAALAKCFPSGTACTAIEGWHEEWHRCVYIDLPTGQASWHYHDSHAHLFAGLPPYTREWDGHDTAEKYRRLAALAAPAAQARTDTQIVEQTEELARLLMLEVYSREAPADTLFRNADDPRGRHVWKLACQAQEILTATDPENAVAEVDDVPAAPQATVKESLQVAALQAGDTYLCKVWGETDLPAAAIVTGLDGVRAFLIAEWLGSADHQDGDGTNSLESALRDMQEQWEREGEAWEWSAEFEIGGVSVQKVGHAAPVAAQAPTMDEAIAAGDGTLHGAIDHWQTKHAEVAAALRELLTAVERSICDGSGPAQDRARSVLAGMAAPAANGDVLTEVRAVVDMLAPALVDAVRLADMPLVDAVRALVEDSRRDAARWRWMLNHAQHVSFIYQVDPITRGTVMGLHGGSLKDEVDAAIQRTTDGGAA